MKVFKEIVGFFGVGSFFLLFGCIIWAVWNGWDELLIKLTITSVLVFAFCLLLSDIIEKGEKEENKSKSHNKQQQKPHE